MKIDTKHFYLYLGKDGLHIEIDIPFFNRFFWIVSHISLVKEDLK